MREKGSSFARRAWFPRSQVGTNLIQFGTSKDRASTRVLRPARLCSAKEVLWGFVPFWKRDSIYQVDSGAHTYDVGKVYTCVCVCGFFGTEKLSFIEAPGVLSKGECAECWQTVGRIIFGGWKSVCVCFFCCFFQSYFHTIAGMFLFRQLFDLLKGMKANQTEFVNWNVDSVLCGIFRELITAVENNMFFNRIKWFILRNSLLNNECDFKSCEFLIQFHCDISMV